MNDDSYRLHAKYYDSAYESKADLVDLPFYLEEVAKSEGTVLEIGCGTGRITKEIAKRGKEVVGIDSSESMLGIQRKAIAGTEYAQRIKLHRGDLRELKLGRLFSTIILPFRVLQHMYSLEEQISAFRCLAEHLKNNGRLIFDVFYPRFDRVYSSIGEPLEELSWENEVGQEVTRTFIKDGFDKIEQSFKGRFIYRTMERDICIQEESTEIKMVCYTVPHILLLLRFSGLKALESYGSFTRTPLDNTAKEIILVAGKAGYQQVAGGDATR